jgi:hypothetical protein
MTGYTVHTGSSVKFSDGWDKIFTKGGKKKSANATGATKQAKASKKKPAKKRGAK